jgi:hypothetical protein
MLNTRTNTIDYASSFSLIRDHVFSFKRMGGWLSDSREVGIDGQRVLLTRVGYRKGDKSARSAHSHIIMIEDAPVQLLWKWNWVLRGDPAYIALLHGSRILVKYGSDREITKLKTRVGASLDHAKDMVTLRLLEDVLAADQLEEIAREEFPLDNRFGSEALSVEQEISRSVSAGLSVANRKQIEAQLKGYRVFSDRGAVVILLGTRNQSHHRRDDYS